MAKNVPKRQNEKLETIKDIAPLKEILSSQEYTLFQDSANEEEKKLFESILLIADKFQESVSKTELNRSSVLARIIYDTLGNDLIDILSNEANLKKFKEKLSDSIKKDTTTEKVSDREIDDIINKAVNDKISVLLGDSSKSSTKKISKEQQNLLDSFRKSFSGLEKTQNKIYKKNRELYNNILTFSKKLKSLNVSQTTAKKPATSISSITTSKKETEKISKTVKTDTNKSESHDTSITSTEKEVTNLIIFNLSSVQNLNDQITAQQKGAEKQNKKDEKKRKSFLSKLLSGTIFLLAAPLIIMGKTLFALGKAILLPLYILSKFSLKKIMGLILKPIHWIGGILGGFFKKQEGEVESKAHKFFRGLFTLIFMSKKFWFFVGFFWGKISKLFTGDFSIKAYIDEITGKISSKTDAILKDLFGPNYKSFDLLNKEGRVGRLVEDIKQKIIKSSTYTVIESTIKDIISFYHNNKDTIHALINFAAVIVTAYLAANSTWIGKVAVGSVSFLPQPYKFIGWLLAIGIGAAAYGISALFSNNVVPEGTPPAKAWATLPTDEKYMAALGYSYKKSNFGNRVENIESDQTLLDLFEERYKDKKERYAAIENFKSLPTAFSHYSSVFDTFLRGDKNTTWSYNELLDLLDHYGDGDDSHENLMKLDPLLRRLFGFEWLGIKTNSNEQDNIIDKIKNDKKLNPQNIKSVIENIKQIYDELFVKIETVSMKKLVPFFMDSATEGKNDLEAPFTSRDLLNYILNNLTNLSVPTIKRAIHSLFGVNNKNFDTVHVRFYFDRKGNDITNLYTSIGKMNQNIENVNLYKNSDILPQKYYWTTREIVGQKKTVSVTKSGIWYPLNEFNGRKLNPLFSDGKPHSNFMDPIFLNMQNDDFVEGTGNSIPRRFSSPLLQILNNSDDRTYDFKNHTAVTFSPDNALNLFLHNLSENNINGISKKNVEGLMKDLDRLSEVDSIEKLSEILSESGSPDTLKNSIKINDDSDAKKRLTYILYKIVEAADKQR